MIKITLKVDGMMCPMCETHANDAIRNNFKVEKAVSSHKDGETVIIAQSDISDSELESAIGAVGYKVITVSREEYVKRGFFSKFFKK